MTNDRLETLMQQFLRENPCGDSADLARFFYEQGREDGKTETSQLF